MLPNPISCINKCHARFKISHSLVCYYAIFVVKYDLLIRGTRKKRRQKKHKLFESRIGKTPQFRICFVNILNNKEQRMRKKKNWCVLYATHYNNCGHKTRFQT